MIFLKTDTKLKVVKRADMQSCRLHLLSEKMPCCVHGQWSIITQPNTVPLNSMVASKQSSFTDRQIEIACNLRGKHSTYI